MIVPVLAASRQDATFEKDVPMGRSATGMLRLAESRGLVEVA